MAKKELIYGCMGLGGSWDDTPISSKDIVVAEKAIETALEIGITYFDHADIYSLGKAEQVFGEVLKNNSGLRDRIMVQSKAGICLHQGINGSSIYNASKAYLIEQAENILKRLQTDYLDVFMVHRPDPLMNPEEVADAFRILKKAGKVKKFGVSNMSMHQIATIQEYCDEPLVANQIELSLAHSLLIDAGVEVDRINKYDYTGVEGLIEYMQKHNLAIQAYSSLAGGRYTGNASLASKADTHTIVLLNQMAEKYNTTPASILLAWIFKIPGTVQPIIGTTNPERIKSCRDAAQIELSRHDWYNLWISARGERIP